MSCGKVVIFLLVIVASISCAPTKKDSSSSKEENGLLNLEPPPYHQTPMNDNHGHQNSKSAGHGQDSDLQNSGSSMENNNKTEQEIKPSPPNRIEDHHDSSKIPGTFGLLANSGLPKFGSSNNENGQPKLNEHQDKAGFVGLDSNFSLPNFGQLFNDFSGSNGSSTLNQLFQICQIFRNPIQQMMNAFLFLSGLGGSNSARLLNLISEFLPHSSRSQRVDLPEDVVSENMAANNGTQDSNPHDRIFFSLLQSFLQTFFDPNSNIFQNSNANRYVTIGCNYTTQAGYSCSGCREQLLCNTNNVGSIRICPRNAPYCYNGVCGSVVNTTACTTTTTG